MTQEGLLALGAHKMLDMPVLSQSRYNPFLDGTTASATNRYSHAIVTTQAVKFIHVIGSEARATLDLASGRV